MTLAFAITAHKIQGQTIPSPTKVVLDLNSIFEDAQAHVMLSRVQQLDQIFILDSLDEKTIRTSPIGLGELHRLKNLSINENPTQWLTRCKNTTKKLRVFFHVNLDVVHEYVLAIFLGLPHV